MKYKYFLLGTVLLTISIIAVFSFTKTNQPGIYEKVSNIIHPTPINPLQITYMRDQEYPGSDLIIEETLNPGSNFNRFIASYASQGLKIYGLLTIPNKNKPNNGFPAIVFNHGYITPQLYTPDGNYIAYIDALSAAGYVVFKPDYRGNGKSQGNFGSEYFSRNYDIDDLNAITSLKKFSQVNKEKIGVWGHSMGGHITLMDLVISKDIKAAVIWAGVTGTYNDILYNWQNRVSYQPDREDLELRNQGSLDLIAKYGSPSENPSFWNSIDPMSNLSYITSPLEIHVSLSDNEVPPDFSLNLYNKLKGLGKNVELYTYLNADHNISQSFSEAMQRTISFFDRYLK